jgi:hypothetical protein
VRSALALVASLVVALVVVAPATATTTVRLKLTTSTPTPAVGQPWRYTLTVRSSSGKPVRARAKLQLLLGTTVVGCWKSGAMAQCTDGAAGDWISFRGKRTGVLQFPAQAVGVRLTFRATVQVQGAMRKLTAPVTVQAAPVPNP